jgi:hypothetical protein
MSRDEVMKLVDFRVAQWVKNKAAWNLSGYSDGLLVKYAKSVPILVYDSDVVPTGGTGGWNEYGCWIEVAIYQAEGGYNMAILPHELTHTVLRDFHK